MPQKTIICAPRNAEEAARLFRACCAAASAGRNVRAAIVESPFRPSESASPEVRSALGAPPDGSGSIAWIEALGPSDEALVLMSHASMNEIQEVSCRDYLAVVGGGVKFADFIAAAREADLYFPHEPDFLSRDATVAEIIMDGTIFSTEGRFGGLREYVLALEIVTPGGEFVRTGSRAIKDVTGYDVAGFLMGSGGRCGMIVKATLRLLPARRSRLPFACAGSAKNIERLADALHAASTPAFLEIFEDEAARVLGGSVDAPALLAGELQATGPGEEGRLLERAKECAPEGLSIRKLGAESLEDYRRFPILALEASGGDRLLCVAYDCRPMAARVFSAYNAMSLYPARRRNYLSLEALPEGFVANVLEAGERARVEMIEKRGARFSRRRVDRSELSRILGPRAGGRTSETGTREREPEASLAERVYGVFDPRMIMLP
jgi:hypothetical protein